MGETNNSRMWTVPAGALLGGGVMFGLTKAFKANTGVVVLFTVVGLGIGGFLGYAR